MKIGIAGVGRMGAAIAARLLEHGYQVQVWNRTAAKAEALGAFGATVARNPEELAERSDVLMSLLTDAAAVREVYEGECGFLRAPLSGKLCVEMSTVRPAVHALLAPQVERREGRYLDCAVGGTVAPAREGRLLALVGGAAQDLERIRPVLSILTRRIEHVGPVGAGARVKLAMNLMMQVCWQSFGEAMALCSPLQIEPDRLIEILGHASGMPPGLAHRLPSVATALATGREIGPVSFNIDMVRKDLRTMLEEARSLGIDLPVAARALDCFDAASSAGRGGEDCAMLPVRRMQAAVEAQPPSSHAKETQ